ARTRLSCSKGTKNLAGNLSMYWCNRPMDSACMAHQSCQSRAHSTAITSATGRIRRREHDLPSLFANRGLHRWRVAHFDQFARVGETGPRWCRPTVSALSCRRSCSADYLSCLDILAAGDDPDGRILSFPAPTSHCVADRLL